jgi:hypothetical protein
MFALAIFLRLADGTIRVERLIQEFDKEGANAEKGEEIAGKTSIARFQILLWTFVFTLMALVIFINNNFQGIPKFDSSVLELLGISTGTYAASKIISTVGGKKKS